LEFVHVFRRAIVGPNIGCFSRSLLLASIALLFIPPLAAAARQVATTSGEKTTILPASVPGQGALRRQVILLAQQTRRQPPSPFEEVPEQSPPRPSPAEPAAPPGVPAPFLDAVGKTADSARPKPDFIEAVEFRGARRIPRDSLLARIFSKPGDRYDEDALRRDFMTLWNTGYFDDLRLEVEDGARGRIVRFAVIERRVVRTIDYEGNKSVTISDILERFQQRRVGLSVESRYDPTVVQRAAVVLKELLGERGRQYAAVTPEVRQIPPSSVAVRFQVDEGPKVKVGAIRFEGNGVMSDRQLRARMKFLKPFGIPKSLLFESLLPKTFDMQKLEFDKEVVRNAYQENGYFRATLIHHDLEIRDATGRRLFPLPFVFPRTGKRADITMHLEEGRQYRRGKLSFSGVKLFRAPETVFADVFAMREGEIFNVKKLRDGMENLKKLYGEFGYIDFVAEPSFEFHDQDDPATIDLHLAVDEDKQFFVRRIDFAGNDTTRDKVIRRELLLDEGDMFSTRLWDLSVLRLNQLGYFEPLRQEDATAIARDTRNGLVDLTLNVTERGKNTVNLNGGVSGFAGSFVGFGYSTNNFLGLGETLTFESQLGTRERVLLFGFSEPYLFDTPIQAGFTVFTRRFNFDAGREASIFSGADLRPFYESLGPDNVLAYRQSSAGFTAYASYPLRRTFSRVGVTYSYQKDRVAAFGASSDNLFRFFDYEGVSGPNALDGIATSEVTPNFFYNSIDHPITPTRGKSLYVSMGVAGFGGSTRFVQPTVEAKWFKPHTRRGNVLGMRFLFSFISGYGGRVPPPYRRAYMGGENDIRGFDNWSVMPLVWIPDSATVKVLNSDGTQRQQVAMVDGVEQTVDVFQEIPVYRWTWPGGDTRLVYNAEYRIPLFGPVSLAPFFDIGFNRITRKGQLRLNAERVAELNARFPQAGFTDQVQVAPGTERLRASAGLELQVMLPVIKAPFRFYWAYNPLRLEQNLQPPIVANRGEFANGPTFADGLARHGTALARFEQRSTFRFTISRTF
jgi:outer membrane protein insertion porin family